MTSAKASSKTSSAFSAAVFWSAAGLLALPPFISPIFNSDLFWHLSTGRSILLGGALPSQSVSALVPPSGPWIDFEWLSQVAYQATYAAGGMFGLWALKAVLLAACAGLLLAALRRGGVGSEYRAGALAVWAAGAMFFADIRPELFSVLLFGGVLWALEAWRARDFALSTGEYAATAAAFALWSSLHGGFVCGLVALGCYLAPELALGRRAAARSLGVLIAAAAAGTLVNPYGWGPHRVILEHWAQGAYLARNLFEWRPLVLRRDVPLQPVAALMAACAALAAARLLGKGPWPKRLPWGLTLCAAVFGFEAARHMRMAAFFDTPAVLLLLIAAREAGWLKSRAARAVLIGTLALDAGFVVYYAPHLPKGFPFAEAETPVAAADFLARERAVVEPLRVYAEWDWGGYLAWRLDPWYRILMDGRYVFHDRLGPVRDAIAGGPRTWEGLLDGWRLNAALVRRANGYYPEIFLPGGRPWGHPWHELYMPRAEWALVYEDPQALFFVRRNAAPAAWIAAHEIARGGPPTPDQ